MRHRRLRWAALVAGAAIFACAVSCGVDIVASPGTADGGGNDGGSSDGQTTIDGGGFEGGVDASDAAPPCSLPTCDDAGGCNAGTICTPMVPTGWRLLAVTDDPGAACGATYEPFADAAIKLSPDAASANCACVCNKTANGACTGSTLNVKYSDGVGCTNELGTVLADDQCHSLPDAGITTSGSTFFIEVDPANASPTCAPTVTPSLPTVDGGQIRACRPLYTGGASCERDHRICLPSPPTGQRLCIASDPLVGAGGGGTPPTCPTGFQLQSFVIGTDALDNRTCTSCTCGATPANCDVAFELFASSSNCQGNTIQVSGGSLCSSRNSSAMQQYQSAKFKITGGNPGGSCAIATTTTLSGEAGAGTSYAVCCAN